MKRILTAMCALLLLAAGCTPALAAAASEPERSCYYPIKVEEYTSGPLDELRIDKVYQLSLSDDPSGIPTEDGYTDTLRLDHTSVQVTTDGYTSKTISLSATRTYPNLSEVKLS